ncbi:MAG: hypothetical protein IJ646_14755 [Clostridia bacterium]|nr:hypothetical protein [Clostridia bacterium]
MKYFINAMGKVWQLVIFAVFGLALVFFPTHLVKVVYQIKGGVMLLFAALNLYACFKNPDHAPFGKTLIYLASGVAVMLQKSDTLIPLGIVWAMLILMECAEEIDEALHSREIHPIPLIWVAISVVLAVMLLSDPAEHFVFHMRILGLEILAYCGLNWWKSRNA